MNTRPLLLLLVGLAGPTLRPMVAATPTPEYTRLKFGSISLYTENDKYFAGTDQHYTNGFKLSFLSTPIANFTDDPVPRPVQQLARTLRRLLPDDQQYKLGLSLGQNIYTPEDTTTATPQPDDRPYAGWLYAGIAFQVYQPARFFATGARAVSQLDVVELTVGVVGPSALGEQVQNEIHRLIDSQLARGWGNQIHDEPGLNLVYERKYRFTTARSRSGWGADFIPHIGASLGNVFTYANVGGEVRAGFRLPTDFGTNLIRPSGDSSAVVRPRFSTFFFASADARAVARDITLDGNTWRDSASIDKKHFVSDLTAGLAVGTTHWQFTYAQAVRTREFEGQKKNSVFGSVSISYYY